MDKIESFNEKGELIFRPFLEKFGYSIDQVIINYLNGRKWSVHHIYLNRALRLKIVLRQEPYYTDYGFSIFIHKLGTEEYNILFNMPHENQDHEDRFLSTICEQLLANTETIELITGKIWQELKRIPLQK